MTVMMPGGQVHVLVLDALLTNVLVGVGKRDLIHELEADTVRPALENATFNHVEVVTQYLAQLQAKKDADRILFAAAKAKADAKAAKKRKLAVESENDSSALHVTKKVEEEVVLKSVGSDEAGDNLSILSPNEDASVDSENNFLDFDGTTFAPNSVLNSFDPEAFEEEMSNFRGTTEQKNTGALPATAPKKAATNREYRGKSDMFSFIASEDYETGDSDEVC